MEALKQFDDIVRVEYERCHPDDSFEALQKRAAFSKEDRYLLKNWRAAIRASALSQD